MKRIAPACLALAAIALIASCDNHGSTPTGHQHTLGEFCAPLVEFFKNELQVDGFRYTNGPAPDKLMEQGSYCIFSSKTTLSGGAWITPLHDDQEALEHQDREQRGFKPLTGHSAEVWMSDHRLTSLEQMNGGLSIATKVGRWDGSIEVVNALEPLTITDEQVRALAELLIDLTRDMGN